MKNSAFKCLTVSLCFAGLFSSTASVASTPAAAPTNVTKATISDVPLINLGSEQGGTNSISDMNSHHSVPAKGQQHKPAVKHDPYKITKPAVRFESKPKAKKPEQVHKVIHTNKVDEKEAVHWGYSGDTGPKYWSELAAEYATCKQGKNQSPIDLKDKAGVGTNGLASLDIAYRDVPLKVINNGHTVQVNYPLGSYIKVGGHRYELLQFHFHTPSEHMREGFNYPMEVHLVHKDGDGNLAVIGIIFQEGEENEALDNLLPYLPKKVGREMMHRGESLNPVNFFPGNQEFYKYSGSLTTPPCSEGVYWMVFKHTIEASYEQIQQLNDLMGDNSRPVQQLNSRTLLKSWAAPVEEPRMYEFY
ncbi:MAG: carbonic anhydrase [Thiomicrorhabdus sp.]|nr:MAG: carbonic anhydrase [Thiomicrorhabdus sp.]